MLRKMLSRKIIVTTFTLVVLIAMYFIPIKVEKNELKLKNNLIEYVYPNTLETIYLLDSDNYLARTEVTTCDCETIDKASLLLEGLILEGKKSDVIPNGFKPILPSDTEILDVTLDNGILTVNFSKELLDITKDYEEKAIESIIYTLTSLKGIDKVCIKVNGETLTKLPISNKTLPTFLDMDYGINKIYELSSLNNIVTYTIYYVNSYNDNYYYVPVTKYVNNTNQDKIKIIIEQMSSAPIYETSLMSFLNVNTKLLDYEMLENSIKLNFNNGILNDITDNTILEEVAYTISLSMRAELGVEEVIFCVEDNEVYKLEFS